MVTSLARFISLVLHPIFMPTALFMVLYYTVPAAIGPFSREFLTPFLGLLVLVTILMPAFTILTLKGFGIISSLYMDDQKERLVPMIFYLLYLIVITAFFQFWLEVNFNITVIFYAIAVMTLFALVINLFIKLSLHAMGTYGFSGFMLVFLIRYETPGLLWALCAGLAAAGLLASARLHLNRHSPAEIYLGASLGFCTALAALYFIQ